MECWIAVDGKNYSFNRAYSDPSKNEGWATLCPVWVREIKGSATRLFSQTLYGKGTTSVVP